MVCKKCQVDNISSAKFCHKCGTSLESNTMGSVDYYFHKQKNQCWFCHKVVPTKHIVFYENIGMIFRRQYRTLDGNLCRDCIDKFFWEYTGKTLILGWWGTISFFVTPFILINNVGRYLLTLGLKRE